MKVIAIIHARMSSSRLPGKVMKDLSGKSVLFHHYERLKACKGLDAIWLATSKDENNKPLIEEAKRYGIPYYAGAEEDVLERYIAIAKREGARAALRCGCDKPLLSYEIVNDMLKGYQGEDLMYVSTPLPSGIGSEILSSSAMERVRKHYRGPAISRYIKEYPHLFKVRSIEVDDEFSRPEFRLTLDTGQDYELIKSIYEKFYKEGRVVDLRQAFKYLDDHPKLVNINRFVKVKQVNIYERDLKKRPAFSVHMAEGGKYVVKNKMGEIIPYPEFRKILANMEWEE